MAGDTTLGGSNAFTFSGTSSITSSGSSSRVLTVSNTGGATFAGAIYLAPDNTTARGLTISGSSDATVSGVIANNNAGNTIASTFSKSGTGKLTLANANTYSGTTSISNGTLLANNSSGSATGSGAVSVNTTGVLAGSGGTISGAVAVGTGVTTAAGGTVTAGSGATTSDTVGKLTTGNQTWNSDGKFYAKFASSSGATAAATGNGSAGSNWDLLAMGTLSISNGFTLTLTKTSAGSFTPGTIGYFKIADTGTITIPNGAGTTTATADQDLTSLFNLNLTGLGLTGDTYQIQAGDDGTDLYFALNETQPAPEPTTAALFGLGGLAVLGRRRTRRAA